MPLCAGGVVGAGAGWWCGEELASAPCAEAEAAEAFGAAEAEMVGEEGEFVPQQRRVPALGQSGYAGAATAMHRSTAESRAVRVSLWPARMVAKVG